MKNDGDSDIEDTYPLHHASETIDVHGGCQPLHAPTILIIARVSDVITICMLPGDSPSYKSNGSTILFSLKYLFMYWTQGHNL